MSVSQRYKSGYLLDIYCKVHIFKCNLWYNLLIMEPTPATIEHDIAELEKLLIEKKAALGQEKSDKETLHEVVGEKIKEHVPEYFPSGKQNQSSLPSVQTPTSITTEPPSYLSQELKDKVREIINIVFLKNLEEGIKMAAKTGNPALMDAFHDILTDELYSQLIEKGKLQKVE